MATPNAPQQSGADILVQCLLNHGVETVFAYPGGASMPIHQALTRFQDRLRTILPRHEQGGGFMAEGYARSTGRVGVCVATSGPGATNFVTCLADAQMDSVPLVAITGQVGRPAMGKDSFQETNVMGMTLPFTKHSFLVEDPDELYPTMRRAFEIARSGRPGPVLVDVPKDVQFAACNDNGYRRLREVPQAVAGPSLEAAAVLLKKAKRPLFLAGHGITLSGAA